MNLKPSQGHHQTNKIVEGSDDELYQTVRDWSPEMMCETEEELKVIILRLIALYGFVKGYRTKKGISPEGCHRAECYGNKLHGIARRKLFNYVFSWRYFK